MRELVAVILMGGLLSILGVVVWIALPHPKPNLDKPVAKMSRYEVAMAQQQANWELTEARQRLADTQRLKATKERALARRRAEQQDQMIREMYTKATGKLPPPTT